MPLSGQEAVAIGLVEAPDGAGLNGVRDASYDLQIGSVVMNGRVYSAQVDSDRQLLIPPQQTFTIVSREVLHIKDGYVAYAFLKTSIARRGILALNTGIIDAGWHNHLATTAINFSSDKIAIFEEDGAAVGDSRGAFLRIAFHKVVHSAKRQVVPDIKPYSVAIGKEYQEKQMRLSRHFPGTFMDVPGQTERIIKLAKKEIVEEQWSRLANLVILITLVALLLAGVIPAMGSWATSLFLAPDNRSSITSDALNILQLRSQVNALERRLNARDSKDSPTAPPRQ